MTTARPFYRAFFAILLFGLSFSAAAQDIRARWTLDSPRVMAGEKLRLTLEVRGTDQVEPPKFSIPGVEITWEGGRPSNSTSIVTINGVTNTTISKAFAGTWNLKAARPGTYHLDGIDWRVNGKTIHLSDLDWTVSEAQTDERFFIKQALSQETTIPGVEVEYTLVWYLGESAQNPDFTLPILDSSDLEPVVDSLKAPQGDVFPFDYRGRSLFGIKDTESLGGKRYTTLTLKFKVKPQRVGTYDLSGTMVTFDGAISTRRTQDFFGNIVEEPAYSPLVARSNPLTLKVKELPTQGKPAVFSGLIGKIRLSWSGVEGPYGVGEPIRLKLNLEGVLNKPNLDLDYMVTQALGGQDFQVTPDSASVSDTSTEHSYVLRARHAGQLIVPSLKLNYFDPETEIYGETATEQLKLDIIGSEGAMDFPLKDTSPERIAGPNTKEKSGVSMNPPGLPGAHRSSVPWWAFAIPGSLGGLVFLILGLWRHSRTRKALIERKAWIAKLSPLAAQEPRGQLEEGRNRIHELLGAGEPWRKVLADKGYWNRLIAVAQEWDRAFFAQNRETEPWTERWDDLCREARGWK